MRPWSWWGFLGCGGIVNETQIVSVVPRRLGVQAEPAVSSTLRNIGLVERMGEIFEKSWQYLLFIFTFFTLTTQSLHSLSHSRYDHGCAGALRRVYCQERRGAVQGHGPAPVSLYAGRRKTCVLLVFGSHLHRFNRPSQVQRGYCIGCFSFSVIMCLRFSCG